MDQFYCDRHCVLKLASLSVIRKCDEVCHQSRTGRHQQGQRRGQTTRTWTRRELTAHHASDLQHHAGIPEEVRPTFDFEQQDVTYKQELEDTVRVKKVTTNLSSSWVGTRR